jgi:hypothetical protein
MSGVATAFRIAPFQQAWTGRPVLKREIESSRSRARSRFAISFSQRVGRQNRSTARVWFDPDGVSNFDSAPSEMRRNFPNALKVALVVATVGGAALVAGAGARRRAVS